MQEHDHRNDTARYYFRSRGLRLKMLLSFMLLITVTTGIMFLLTYNNSRQLALDKLHHRIELLANVFSLGIDAEIETARRGAEKMAADPALRSLTHDDTLPDDFARKHLSATGFDDADILLKRPDGKMECIHQVHHHSKMDMLCSTPETNRALAAHGAVVFALPKTSRNSVYIAAPITGLDGLPKGVVAVQKELNTVQFGTIMKSLDLGNSMVDGYLVDFNGKVLDGRDESRIGKNIFSPGMPLGENAGSIAGMEKRNAFKPFNFAGVKYIGAAATVNRELGWKVIILQPYDEVFDAVRRLSLRILFVGGLSLLVAFGLAMYRSHRIIAPIGDLLDAADEIASGEYGKRVKVHRRDEVGSLALAFNRMSAALQEKITAHQHSQEQLKETFHQLQIDARKRERKVRELMSISEVTSAISNSLDINVVLTTITNTINNVMGFTTCSIKLLDGRTNTLAIMLSTGLPQEYLDKSPTRVGHGISGQAVQQRCGIVIEDIDEDPRVPADHILRNTGVKSLCCIPLMTKKNVLGVLNIYTREHHIFTEDEMRLLSILANQAASAIENARLFDDLRENYFNTIEALSMTIDAKDPYTHGHSKRVSEFSILIGRQMGLQPDDLQMLKHAGDLHDIGKIGISEAIIGKDGKLSVDEYEIIKTHPLVGETIIEPVPFLKEVKKVIRHHHERHDGYGYPDGLKGMEIPLMARILHLADAYDAMTSDRPYRKALKREEAMREIRKHAGTQFDPEVVDAFEAVDEAAFLEI